jgi:segregation and condensation protein B
MTEPMNDTDPQNDPETATEAASTAPEDSAAPAEPVEIDPHHLRLLEAVLFAATEPLTEFEIVDRLPEGAPVPALLAAATELYANRGVNLTMAGGRWFFRTAEDLAEELRVHMKVPRRLSRAAMETLAIVAYHQPVTRAEIEEIRGVGLSKGTLDALFESGWIAPRGRRRTAGRPVTWGTTPGFLQTFGLAAIGDLPGLDDLRAAGLLDKRPAIQITDVQNEDDEEPLADDEELLDMDLPDEEAGSAEDGDEEPEGEEAAAGENIPDDEGGPEDGEIPPRS